jgi:hypothetical protein
MGYVGVDEAALRLLVVAEDIKKLAEEGFLTLESIDGVEQVTLASIQELLKSMPPSLLEKMGNLAWTIAEELRPQVSNEVNDRFTKNLKPLLDRAEQTIQLLERIHAQHEPSIDVLQDRRGSVAAFIILARVVSLLYSALALLRSSVPSEALLLLRTIWEGGLLVRYFAISEKRNENAGAIRHWFEKDESPAPKVVRGYISEHLGIPLESLRESYRTFSKPVHLTYQAVMDSYRVVSMDGMLGTRMKRLGFDYHKSRVMRDVVSLYFAFEQILLNALMHFRAPFAILSPLSEPDEAALTAEIDFYRQDFRSRLASVPRK